jgi:hypothetical protein
MKVRILEKPNGIFYIQEYRCLKFYGATGCWYNSIPYQNDGLNEDNYFHSLEEATAALDRMKSNIKNPKPNGIVHIEDKI